MEDQHLNFFKFLSKEEKKRIPIIYGLINNLLERDDDGKIHIRESVIIRSLKLDTLPNGLIIHGFLDLDFSTIVSLPDDLTIYGYLSIQHTKIIDFPKNLNLMEGKFLFINGTPLARNYSNKQIFTLYPSLKAVFRNETLEYNPAIHRY
jgi:hypothetical protein